MNKGTSSKKVSAKICTSHFVLSWEMSGPKPKQFLYTYTHRRHGFSLLNLFGHSVLKSVSPLESGHAAGAKAPFSPRTTMGQDLAPCSEALIHKFTYTFK